MTDTQRKYVGARYVPLIMGEWDSTASYEPLSVVLYEGNSYTSRTFVPAGIPIDNEVYWALSGNYNAQEDGEANGVVLIGDSYGQGYTPDGTVTSWVDLLELWIENYNVPVFSECLGGAGFASSTKFITALTTLVGTMTDEEKGKISTVLVGGGYNDKGYTSAQIYSGMMDFAALVKTSFPNCDRMILCAFGMCVEGLTTGDHASATYEQMALLYRRYYETAPRAGFFVAQNGYALLRNDGWFSSDYVHPNSSAQWTLADFAMNALCGYSFNPQIYWPTPVEFSFSYGDGTVTTAGTGKFNACVRGDRAYVIFNNFNIGYKSGHYPSISCNGQTANDLTIPIEIKHAVMQKYGKIYIPDVSLVVAAEDGGTTKYFDINGWITIDLTNQTLTVSMLKINSTNTNYFSLTNIHTIQCYLRNNPISYSLLWQNDV